jgi:UDPglucose--hexose-1-phosphate uridylyltransferase
VPELRHDELTGRLVLLSPAREARPYTTRPSREGSATESCPFCPGHEHETPPEVARAGPGEPDTPGWRVRVVPNLYPIVGGPDAGAGATGVHEVVVLSPDHRSFGEIDDDEAVEVFTMLRERARVHAAAGREHVQVLINEGRAAGASIAHPHAQVLALDFVPPAVTVATQRFEQTGGDLVWDDQAHAIGNDQGVVVGPEVRAWCPYGAASPFEVRIATREAVVRLEDARDAHILGVALVLRDVLARLGRVLDGPSYNVVVHNAAAHDDVRYHWWVEVVPRIAVVAGFELGTGLLVNTVTPEESARRLRDASPT